VHGTRSWLWGAGPALVVLLAAASAAAPLTEPPVKVSATVSKARLSVGQTADLTIDFDIAEGWHINSNEPGLEFLIPTSVSFEGPAGVRMVDVRFPPPVVRKLELGGGKELKLYEGRVSIPATLRYESTAAPAAGAGAPVAVVRYQACNDSLCLRPQTLKLPVEVEVTS
jgi:DsbC/DsbD-like thiol-disulfide interchange protein